MIDFRVAVLCSKCQKISEYIEFSEVIPLYCNEDGCGGELLRII